MTDYESCPAEAVWEVARPEEGGQEPTWRVHARADAELDLLEGRALLDALSQARVEQIVLRLPDSVTRTDLPALVRHVAALPPSTTVEYVGRARVTEESMDELAAARVDRIAVGLDGADADTHDAFRAAPGSFAHTRDVMTGVSRRGIGLEVVTQVHEAMLGDLVRMARLVTDRGAQRWRVHFPITPDRLPTTEQVDRAIETLLSLEQNAGFVLDVRALPHLERIRAERGVALERAPALDDGRGLLFVTWCGDIYPSVDLPLPCGNVRMQDVLAVYRFHPMFRMLRDAESLEGRCGACQHKRRCGGSRARGFAVKGEVLASDPLCGYRPPNM